MICCWWTHSCSSNTLCIWNTHMQYVDIAIYCVAYTTLHYYLTLCLKTIWNMFYILRAFHIPLYNTVPIVLWEDMVYSSTKFFLHIHRRKIMVFQFSTWISYKEVKWLLALSLRHILSVGISTLFNITDM